MQWAGARKLQSNAWKPTVSKKRGSNTWKKNAGWIFVYKKVVVKVFMRQIEVVLTEGEMQICNVEKRMMHSMNTSLFGTLSGRVRQRLLQRFLERVFWN